MPARRRNSSSTRRACQPTPARQDRRHREARTRNAAAHDRRLRVPRERRHVCGSGRSGERTRAVNPFRLMALTTAQAPLIAAGAVGAIIVMPFSDDVVVGLYTFGVPAIHQCRRCTSIARLGRPSSMRRRQESGPRFDSSPPRSGRDDQLFGHLPGKDYGTPNDSQVLLVTHTDGPSISQENGALGILSMVRYFSRVPQAERPRTLMVFFDPHFMPGRSGRLRKGLRRHHPDFYKGHRVDGHRTSGADQGGGEKGRPVPQDESGRVVAVGDQQPDADRPCGARREGQRVEPGSGSMPRATGSHGKSQAPWYGLGGIANRLNIPGYGAMGLLSAYWTTRVSRVPGCQPLRHAGRHAESDLAVV